MKGHAILIRILFFCDLRTAHACCMCEPMRAHCATMQCCDILAPKFVQRVMQAVNDYRNNSRPLEKLPKGRDRIR